MGDGHHDLRLRASQMRVSGDAEFERFTVGGAEPVLVDARLLPQRIAMPAAPLGVRSGERVSTLEASIGEFLGFRPFLWAASSDPELRGWYRVAGLDAHLAVDNLPLLRLGGLEVRSGVGYPLDAPFRHRWRFYGSAIYRP